MTTPAVCWFYWRNQDSDDCYCRLPLGHPGDHKDGADGYRAGRPNKEWLAEIQGWPHHSTVVQSLLNEIKGLQTENLSNLEAATDLYEKKLDERDRALRDLIDRLTSHETYGCCHLDARDREAIKRAKSLFPQSPKPTFVDRPLKAVSETIKKELGK